MPLTARLHRGTHSKPQAALVQVAQTSNSNFVIDEGSIITDEMIRGINKPVAVPLTR